MNCFVSGIVGLAMLGASFSTMGVSEEQHNALRNTLSEELDRIYENIAHERRNHYIQGLLLGCILAFLVLQVTRITNRFHKMSFFFAIALTTTVVYYSVMPKSDYMLNHLKTEEQNKAWLDIYKTMKQRYFAGLVLGALAAIPISYAMC